MPAEPDGRAASSSNDVIPASKEKNRSASLSEKRLLREAALIPLPAPMTDKRWELSFWDLEELELNPDKIPDLLDMHGTSTPSLPHTKEKFVDEALPIGGEPCPFGDLVVRLTNSAKEVFHFRVSSASLRLASPVWSKMLDPRSPFFPGSLKRRRLRTSIAFINVLDLNDDDEEALTIVFWIVHMRSDRLPESVSFSRLRQLAILCDKYDCVSAVISVVQPWLDIWSAVATEDGYEDWLFIGPVFGDERNFQDLNLKIIKQMKITYSGWGWRRRWPGSPPPTTNISNKGKPIDIKLISPTIIGEIKTQRERVVNNIQDILRRYNGKLRETNKARRCSSENSVLRRREPPSKQMFLTGAIYSCSEQCMSIAYGSLQRCLSRTGLEQRLGLQYRDFSEWENGLDDLFSGLKDIKIRTKRHSNNVKGCGLADCEADLKWLIDLERKSLTGLQPGEFMRYKRPARRKLTRITDAAKVNLV